MITDEEPRDRTADDQWATSLVLRAAFMHIRLSRSCIGYTIASSGRTICGACEWRLSARLADAGELGGARFALFALAAIGEVIALAARAAAAEAS